MFLKWHNAVTFTISKKDAKKNNMVLRSSSIISIDDLVSVSTKIGEKEVIQDCFISTYMNFQSLFLKGYFIKPFDDINSEATRT